MKKLSVNQAAAINGGSAISLAISVVGRFVWELGHTCGKIITSCVNR